MKKLLSILSFPAFVIFVFSGCFKDPEPQVCTYDACAIKAPDSQIVAVKHYLDSLGITATQHCSGLFYTIDSTGTGAAPGPCQGIAVRYKGKLTNGKGFDSSDVDVPLLLGNVIAGWRNGLPLLKQGGGITLYIPPALGYGNKDQYSPSNPNQVLIPANSILIFNVALTHVYL